MNANHLSKTMPRNLCCSVTETSALSNSKLGLMCNFPKMQKCRYLVIIQEKVKPPSMAHLCISPSFHSMNILRSAHHQKLIDIQSISTLGIEIQIWNQLSCRKGLLKEFFPVEPPLPNFAALTMQLPHEPETFSPLGNSP